MEELRQWPRRLGFRARRFWQGSVNKRLMRKRTSSLGCAKRAAGEPRITRLGWGLLAMVAVQFTLGVLVIWKSRQSHITNTHVMVGAFICATTALLAARSWQLKPTR